MKCNLTIHLTGGVSVKVCGVCPSHIDEVEQQVRQYRRRWLKRLKPHTIMINGCGCDAVVLTKDVVAVEQCVCSVKPDDTCCDSDSICAAGGE